MKLLDKTPISIIDPAIKKRNDLRLIKVQLPEVVLGKDFLDKAKRAAGSFAGVAVRYGEGIVPAAAVRAG